LFALGATLYVMVTGEPPYGRHAAMAEIFFKKVGNEFTSARRLVPELSRQTDRAIWPRY
jgi:hypothetical protein